MGRSGPPAGIPFLIHHQAPSLPMKRPVTRITDYRPAPAATLTRAPDMDEHDRQVRPMANQTLIAAAEDLCARKVWDKKDPETRWVLGRRAALLREIRRRGLTQHDRQP